MGAYQISCAAMLFGFSIASPIARRQFNNGGYNGAGNDNNAGSWTSWTPNNNAPGQDDGSWTRWNAPIYTMPPTPISYTWPSGYAWNAGTNFTTTVPPPSTTTLLASYTSIPTTTLPTLPPTTTLATSTLITITSLPSVPTTTTLNNATTTTFTTLSPTPTLSPYTYSFYQGDGSQADGWPTVDQWESFDNMWTNNQALIANSCVNLGTPPNNDADETAAIYNSIVSLAASTGVDARFILAVMIQESKGCVRVITTFGSHANPGLMQDNQGNHTCNDAGVLSIPCLDDQIFGMLSDGVAGTASGDGLQQLLADPAAAAIDGELSSNYYKAARMYNSGSIDPSGDLGAGGSTHCYASDIANRVMGWVFSPSTCTL